MPAARDFSLHAHRTAAGILLAVLVATWLAYSPGIGGSLHFDDLHNLAGLSDIHDRSSAFRFITTGESGPLGRPIALASFAAQAYAWPDSPEVFLRTNILIHLLNGALVAWLLYLLGLAQHQTERKATLIGAASGGIWMLMPMLASSSLFIVQRMTTLSAAFVLLGAIAYLYARRLSQRSPTLALSAMTIALLGGATLGAFTKENGVLLFVFVLVLESTLLAKPDGIPRTLWRGWFTLVLVAPFVLLLYYLAANLPYSEAVILIREFNGFERLITQAGILWKYLYLSFLPNAGALGPFHDDYAAQRSLFRVTTMLAVAAWLTVVSAAILLRRKAPLFAFAVAWYLLGHSLESSAIPLELYFEHRNYLPLVGPVYALTATVLSIGDHWQRILTISLAAYALMLGGVLFSVTSLWGSPTVAAEIWHLYKPASRRATLALAQELQREGYVSASRRLLARFVEANPESDTMRLQILPIACLIDREADQGEVVRLLEERLRSASFDFGVPATLAKLHTMINDGHCPILEAEDVLRLSRSVLENPKYIIPLVRHNLHVLIADIGADRRDLDLTMTHLREALYYYPNPNTLRLALSVLVSAGLYETAEELVEEAEALRPRHPIQATRWNSQLQLLERAVQDAKRHELMR
jgi:protein O-mannosyl-transferase